jgi:hypothetical protein
MKYVILPFLIGRLALGCEGGTLPPERCEPNANDTAYEVSDRTYGLANAYGSAVEQGRLAERTNFALNALIRLAAHKLRQRGYRTKAKQLVYEWEHRWNGYLMRRDLGDHRPLSQWLAEKYAMIEAILGENLCKLLRLYDIKVINYAIPVVFSCVDKVDEAEYGRHFVPLSGVVVFWTSFFVCVGATWGTGFLFCSPLAMGAEFLVVRLVAPKLNPTAWRWACKPGGSYPYMAY